MSIVVEHAIGLSVIECSSCGTPFGLTEFFESKRRENHKTFYCPNGHTQYFPNESKAEKYERLYNLESDRRAAERAKRDQAEASLRATKGVVTKQRQKLERVSKGVCPCCNRSFSDLKRHMKAKHPDYNGQPQ